MNVDELLAYIFSNAGSWVSVKQTVANAIPVQFFKVAQVGGRCIQRKVLNLATTGEDVMSEDQFRVMFMGTIWEKVSPAGSGRSYTELAG
jgi:hypothetical protein